MMYRPIRFVGLIWVVLQLSQVFSYSDVRGTVCMDDYLVARIPANRSSWSGDVQLVMSCDLDYDFPLNTPEGGVFHCFPTNTSWQPSYFPDCIRKVEPTKINIVAAVKMSKSDCGSVGVGDLSIKGTRVDATDLCSGIPLLTQCSVVAVTPACDPRVKVNTPPSDTTDLAHWATEVMANHSNQPYVLVVIEARHDNNVRFDDYSSATEKVIEKMRDHWGRKSLEWSLKAECPPGRLGVEVKGSGHVLCRGCSLGHKLNKTLKVCTPCRPGFYQDEELQLTCKICPSLKGLDNPVLADLWTQVNKKVPDRSHSLARCPGVVRHANGSYSVLNPSDMDEDPYKNKTRSKSAGNTTQLLKWLDVLLSTLMCVVCTYI